MDGDRFDDMVRALLSGASRRGLLQRLSALPLAGGLAAFLLDDDESAAKKGKKKRKKRKRRKRKKRKRKKRKRQNRNKAACNGADVCASGCPFASVQAAIDAAAPGDTITLCAETFTGNLTIAKDLTLAGAGADATTLQGDGAGTVVTITAGTVRIENLRISGGVAEFEGGGISNEGTLTLSGCTVTGNRTTSEDAYGNGIYNEGALTVEDCTISENVFAASGISYGGGIYSEGTLTVTNSVLSGNRATSGGALYSNTPFGGGSTTLTGCDLSDNVAVEHEFEAARGGAIWANSELTLTVTDCTIRNNSAPDGGGAYLVSTTAVLTNCEISGNSASGEGGGILNFDGTLTLDNTDVTENSAGTTGGGIYNFGPFDPFATVSCTNGSTVSGNTGGNCVDAGSGSGCNTCPA